MASNSPRSLTRPITSGAAAASGPSSFPAYATLSAATQQDQHHPPSTSHPSTSQHQQPPSPPQEDTTTLVESPISTLTHALQESNLATTATAAAGPSTASHPPGTSESMYPTTKEKDIRPRLEILLDNDEPLVLRGTTIDVEPVRLSGHVALYLAESTSIKEITLQFRGKAKLPVVSNEHHSIGHSSMTYVICTHDWSFLEGERKHSHTLKAGRHFFPFQLQVGGSLPSSMHALLQHGYTASVAYKLRAHVSRPGLSHNLQCTVPVAIVRSFTAEALEYQQTLEIENTWPEKIMYSIMIPHKAWAVGDSIQALVKFSPLAKGVRVLSVTTTMNETVKLYNSKVGHVLSGTQHEHVRVSAFAKHFIVDGKAVRRTSASSTHPSTPATANTPHRTHSQNNGAYFPESGTLQSPGVPSESSQASPSSPGPSSAASSFYSRGAESAISASPVEEEEEPSSDVVATVSINIPTLCTPTHSLDPISVSHRIRWNILISNPDGHTSELRCSLPVHILDGKMYKEARAHTAATRRLLLGEDGVSGSSAGGDEEAEEDGPQLPSYSAHIRDRIANQFLPDSSVVRINNPWINLGFSPTISTTPGGIVIGSGTASGWNSPLEPAGNSHLPSHPPPQGDWCNSELLISLREVQQQAPPQQGGTTARNSRNSTPPENQSPPSSRGQSRRASRRSSPERHHHQPNLNESYVHGESQASRNVRGVFSASMKPFSSLTHPSWHFSSSSPSLPSLPRSTPSSFTNLAALANTNSNAGHHYSPQHQSSHSHSQPGSGPDPRQESLHRAFTEVPDYGVAARGFIGGVPPLDSMRGLPSYDEANVRAGAGRPQWQNGTADGGDRSASSSDGGYSA